jgi:hypothetical protein
MLSKLTGAALILFTSSFAAASTTAIGAASARGEMRVDGYPVRGNATLFDGTVVETGQATATLRLDKGAEIILSGESRGTLYHDHLVLQKGAGELSGRDPFPIEADGLHVSPSQPNSQTVVSLSDADMVEVASLTGGVQVTNNQGLLIGSVRSGRMMSFAMQEIGSPSDFTGTGTVSFENGHYYLTEHAPDFKYEIKGKNLSKDIGKTVTLTGKLDSKAKPDGDALAVVVLKSTDKAVVIGTLAFGGAAAVALTIFEVTGNTPPASR